MKLPRFMLVTSLCLPLFAASRGHAQMPTDNDTWKLRCTLLAKIDANSATGNAPAWMVAATHKVPGSKFTTFGFDRDTAAQHYVACTLFYLGAIAEKNGNGGKPDPDVAHLDAVLAELQLKEINHQSSTFSEGLIRTRAKAREISKPALTVADEEAVLDAATTMPLSKPAPPAAKKH